MAKKYKTIPKVYAAWDYKQEIADLDRLSEQGWQLVEGRLFGSKFEQNPNLRYRYQLDYRKVTDLPRYIETFREQGWEYVNSTFNDWHYFRKLYDPSLPESEYEILTDTQSVREMTGRWAKLGVFFLVLMGLILAVEVARMIWQPRLPVLMQTLSYLLLFGMFFIGVRRMRQPERKRAKTFPFVLIFLLVCGSLGASIVLDVFRPDMSRKMHAAEYGAIPAGLSEAVCLNQLNVRYPDNYPMRLEVHADAPVTVTITNEKETVLTLTGTDIKESIRWMPLTPGFWNVYLSDFAGGAIDVEYRVK